MKYLSLLLISIVFLPVLAQTRPTQKIVDLTYPFGTDSVYWPTAEAFKLDTDFDGTTDAGYYYSAKRYSAAEHGGTHIDAPVHFAKGR
jgi:kynurenine formamidase